MKLPVRRLSLGSFITLTFTLLISCGPSRSELHAGFDDCYERYVGPHDREILAVEAIDSFLYGLHPDETLTVSQFVDLLEVGNLRQYVDIEFSDEEIEEIMPEMDDFVKEFMSTPRDVHTFRYGDLSKRSTVGDWNSFLWNVIGEDVSAAGSAMYDFCDEEYADRWG